MLAFFVFVIHDLTQENIKLRKSAMELIAADKQLKADDAKLQQADDELKQADAKLMASTLELQRVCASRLR